MRSVYQEIRHKDALKRQGHDLIDAIERLGVAKGKTYRRMARILNLPQSEVHFTHVHKEEKLLRMIAVLTDYRNDITRHRPKRVVVRYKHPPTPKKKKRKAPLSILPVAPKGSWPKVNPQVLPRDQMLKALADLKEARAHYKSAESEGAIRLPVKSPIKEALRGLGVIN